MTIHWSVFVPGVLLLLIPADRLLSSQVELRSFNCFQSLENSPRFRPWWWVPALWLDPARGFLGVYLLQLGLTIPAGPWEFVPKAEYAVCMTVLAIAVVGQTLTRRGDPGVLLAPLGFAAGLVLALTSWPVALISIVTALVGLFALRQFPAYFAFGLGAVAVLGIAFEAPMMGVVPAVGVFALPILTALVTGGTLELPTRNSAGPPARAARSL